MAKLYFRYGAMGCGKSAQLLQTAYNYQERNLKACIMKPKLDTRKENKIYTRIGLEKEVDYLIEQDDDLWQIINDKFKNYNCILIDEAQFLQEKQVDALMQVAIYLDIPVICYGLRTDFLTNGFKGSTRLLQIAHSIEELKTICRCGKKAIYNVRYINGKVAVGGESILIDNKDNVKYVSMCPKCYYEETKKAIKKEEGMVY